jgi:hypothetical protein
MVLGRVVVDVGRGKDGLESESGVGEGLTDSTFEFGEEGETFVADGDGVWVILLEKVDLGKDSMGEERGGKVVEAVLLAHEYE